MMLPSVKIKKILYATDLSENAHYAFAYAVSMANLYGATIVILHVLTEVSNLDTSVQAYIGADQWEEIKGRNIKEVRESLAGKKRERGVIREALDRFCKEVKSTSGENFETDEILVKRGSPAEVILEQSLEKNCDLIIMGTHGHGFLADVMMGSTAKKVIRGSEKPVLVVRLPKK
jgi:nucleotide-binding universal stress UspA family protein